MDNFGLWLIKRLVYLIIYNPFLSSSQSFYLCSVEFFFHIASKLFLRDTFNIIRSSYFFFHRNNAQNVENLIDSTFGEYGRQLMEISSSMFGARWCFFFYFFIFYTNFKQFTYETTVHNEQFLSHFNKQITLHR